MIFLPLFASLTIGSFQEDLYPSFHQVFEQISNQEEIETDKGQLTLFNHPDFGKVVAVDGIIRMTEKDEYAFHEMLVHPALLTHGKPLDVLIIDGSLGGALKEVVKHIDVKKIKLLDSSRAIESIIQKALPEFSKAAFEDERVEIEERSLTDFLTKSEEEFDIILYDSTSRVPKELSQDFYQMCLERLKAGGILVTPIGSPFFEKAAFMNSIKERKAVFSSVAFVMSSIPSFSGGSFVFGFTSDVKHQVGLENLKRRLTKVQGKLKYYTPSIHKAAFVMQAHLLPSEKPN